MRNPIAFTHDFLRRLRHDRKGAVALIFGLLFIPVLVCAVGMAVDLARLYTVKIRLGAALDAAALAVGSTTGMTDTQLQTRLQAYFNSNFPANSLGSTNVSVGPNPPTASLSASTVDLVASATVPMTFMQIFNIPNVTVSATNEITKSLEGLELALVLDNTGSMNCGDHGLTNCSASPDVPHMTPLKSDANLLVDTLFNSNPQAGKLKIAIVPYVTAVNVGADAPSLVPNGATGPLTYINGTAQNGATYTSPLTANLGANIVYSSTDETMWAGCVIEPVGAQTGTVTENTAPSPGPGPNGDTRALAPDTSDVDASGNPYWKGTIWNAYWYASSAQAAATPNVSNTWTRVQTTTTGSGSSRVTTTTVTHTSSTGTDLIAYPETPGQATTSPLHGPNNGCPTPITRLTTDHTTLTNAINSMKAMTEGGTMIHVGMVWGWRVLAPQTYSPFTNASSVQDYNAKGWIKAVVLETDGQNEFVGQLTGFGMQTDGRVGPTTVTTSQAVTNLDQRLYNVCANMKARGIIIYTVALVVGTGAPPAPLTACATDANHAFVASDSASLQSAFSQIANSLNSLRLSK